MVSKISSFSDRRVLFCSIQCFKGDDRVWGSLKDRRLAMSLWKGLENGSSGQRHVHPEIPWVTWVVSYLRPHTWEGLKRPEKSGDALRVTGYPIMDSSPPNTNSSHPDLWIKFAYTYSLPGRELASKLTAAPFSSSTEGTLRQQGICPINGQLSQSVFAKQPMPSNLSVSSTQAMSPTFHLTCSHLPPFSSILF